MTIETSLPSASLALAAILGSGYFVAVMWPRRHEPTAGPLLGLAVTLLVTAVLHLLHVHVGPTQTVLAQFAGEEFADRGWVSVVLTSYIAVLGLWTVFVFGYTGRGTRVRRLVMAIVGGLFVLEVGSLTVVSTRGGLDPRVVDAVLLGSLILVQVLAVVGVFLVLDESTRVGPLEAREAVALSLAAGTLFSSAWLFIRFRIPLVFTSQTLASSVLFSFAVRRYSMFESLPVASVLGRERVIQEMTDAVVVVGKEGQIQDMNPAAKTLFGTESTHLDDWETLFPASVSLEDVRRTDQPVRVTLAERVVAMTVTEVSDPRGEPLGQLVVCQDVTQRRERERRLSVVNRFLVETVSDRMDRVGTEAADIAAADSGVPTESGERIWQTTTNLITVLTYVREIESALDGDEQRHCDVPAVADAVARDLALEAQQPTVTIDGSPTTAAIESSLLETVLELLVANGVDSSPGSVELAVSETENSIAVTLGAEDAGEATLNETAVTLAQLTVQSAGGTLSTLQKSGTTTSTDTELMSIRLPTTEHSGRSGEVATTADPADGSRNELTLGGEFS